MPPTADDRSDTTVDAAALLADATRCRLARQGADDPLGAPHLVPMVVWSDGRFAWMSTTAGDPHVQALREDGSCRVWFDPPGGAGAGVAASGRARVFGAHDPLGLALHGPTVSAAMAALAVRHAPNLLGLAQDAAAVPRSALLQQPVVLRVELVDPRVVRLPPEEPGVAPPLPTAVPADVRRVLAGRRRGVLASGRGQQLAVQPVVAGAGYRLAGPPGAPLADGPAALTLDVEPAHRPTQAVGLTLQGDLVDGALQPRRATWWWGFEVGVAEVTARPVAPFVLPD